MDVLGLGGIGWDLPARIHYVIDEEYCIDLNNRHTKPMTIMFKDWVIIELKIKVSLRHNSSVEEEFNIVRIKYNYFHWRSKSFLFDIDTTIDKKDITIIIGWQGIFSWFYYVILIP